jgi:hypothetical protein
MDALTRCLVGGVSELRIDKNTQVHQVHHLNIYSTYLIMLGCIKERRFPYDDPFMGMFVLAIHRAHERSTQVPVQLVCRSTQYSYGLSVPV